MENILIKITTYFLKHPYKEIYLRGLARELKLSPYSIKKYVDMLIKEGIIGGQRKANLRYFKANTENLFYRYLKIAFNLKVILDSKLLEFLKENIPNLSAIVLFGSVARGEDTKSSDIDLVVIGKRKYLSLREIETKLKREVKPHIFSWSEWKKEATENKAFYYEVIIYGIALYGELPVVR